MGVGYPGLGSGDAGERETRPRAVLVPLLCADATLGCSFWGGLRGGEDSGGRWGSPCKGGPHDRCGEGKGPGAGLTAQGGRAACSPVLPGGSPRGVCASSAFQAGSPQCP